MSIAIKRNFTIPSTSSIGASEISLTSSTASTSVDTGAIVSLGGAGISGAISLGGPLKLYNGNYYTAFDSAATANTTYTWPATSPSTGTSVLSSDSAGNLSWILMSASGSGLTLNGLDASTQYFSTFVSGSGFSISSIGSTHTFYIGLAGNASTGLISGAAQTIAGQKTFTSTIIGDLSGTATTSQTLNTVSASTNTNHYILFSPANGGSGVAVSSDAGLLFNPASNTLTTNTFSAAVSVVAASASVSSSTVSTSTSTGALTVIGGVGVGGSLWTATTNFSSISGVGHSNSVITSGVWSGTAISAVNGGTGLASYTTGDILYASSSTSLGKITAGSAGSILTSAGTGSTPYWSAPSATGVTSLAASTGISVNASTGVVTVTNTGVIALTGTANQVLVNGSSGVATSGNITLTTSQSIGTASSPSFADVTLSTGSNSTVAAVGSAPTSIVNKQYVDNLASGLDIHKSMRVLQASAIGASYVQTQISGFAATSAYLISTTQVALPAIDSVTISATGTTQRILITGGFTGNATIGGTSPFTPGNSFIGNGVYYVGALGGAGTSNWILIRATDSDDNIELTGGTFTFIEEGVTYGDTGWVCSNDTTNQGPIQFGSTAITFTQFTGGGALSVGQGLNKVSNTIAAKINISSVGTASGSGFTQFNLGGLSGGGAADTGYYPTFGVRTSGVVSGSAILTLNSDGFSLLGSTNLNRTITVTGSDITLTGGGNTLTLTGSISLPAPTANGIAYGSSSTAISFLTASGSGASVLTQTSGSAPIYLSQSQLNVGNASIASSSALINIDASTGTRYLLGAVSNTASGSTQVSVGSGITIGNNLLTSGGIAVTSSTTSTSSTTGALTVSGGAGIAKTSYFAQDVKIQGATASTTPTTGALTVTGGVGISGNLRVGTAITSIDSGTVAAFAGSSSDGVGIILQNKATGSYSLSYFSLLDSYNRRANLLFWDFTSVYGSQFWIQNDYGSIKYLSSSYGHEFDGQVRIISSTASTSATAGALTVTGGAGISKTSYFGETVFIQGTTASGSTTTGALVVTGGVGIGGSLNVFGTIDVANNIEVLSQKEVRFFNSANTFYTGLRSGSSSANVTFTLPIADGSANQVLYTNGSAALGWTSISASSTGITSLNGLVTTTQTFATSISGTGFTIGSSTSTHTFYVGLAGNASTGLISSAAQTLFGLKSFGSGLAVTSGTASTNTTTGALTVAGGVGITGQLSVNTIALGNTGVSVTPSMTYVGSAGTVISMSVLSDTTLAWEGSSGQLFSIDNNLSSGEIFSVSDISGLPVITASAGQTITLNEFGGFTQVGNGLASTNTTTGALRVIGGVGITGSLYLGSPLLVPSGGTGLSTYTTGDILYASSSSTLARIAAGTAGSILTSAGSGTTPYWAAATGSTLSVSGTTNGDIQYKSGSALGASSSLNFDSSTSTFKITGFPIEAVSSGSANVKILGGSVSWNGSINGTMLAINTANTYTGDLFNAQTGGTSRFKVSYTGAVSIGNSYTLPITDGTANQVLQTDGSGTVSWANSVNSSAQYNIGYYASAGAAVTGSSTFTNNTSSGVVSIGHSTVSTGTSTGALVVSGGAGIGGTLNVGGNIRVGSNTFTKSGFSTGDVLLDNGSTDTPGLLFYWGNNKNIGIDTFYSGSGTTRFRIVKELNETGGAEIWSVDRNGIVSQTAWAPGEIIKTTVLVGSDLTGSNPTTINSTSDTDVASYSYTPVSSSSYILIEFQTRYTIAGAAEDNYISRIAVDGAEQTYGQQYWINGAGGGTRSGVLFPLMARYTNSNTTAKTISVTVRRGVSDDNATVQKDSTTVMKITEIGR